MITKEGDTHYLAEFQALSVIFFSKCGLGLVSIAVMATVAESNDHSGRKQRPQCRDKRALTLRNDCSEH